MQESRRGLVDELSSVDSFPGLASRAQLTPAQSPYGSPPQSSYHDYHDDDDDVPLLRAENHAPLIIHNDNDDVPLIIWLINALTVIHKARNIDSAWRQF